MTNTINVFSKDLRKIVKKDCPLIEGLYVEFYDDVTAGDVRRAQAFQENKDLTMPLEMLVNQIADWNFADNTMEKLEISLASLDKLPSKLLTWLFEAQAAILQEVDAKKKESPES